VFCSERLFVWRLIERPLPSFMHSWRALTNL
jgi:hypothetical protein